MRLRRLKSGIRATAPCKINLHLEVLSRRSDGYHDIETVMLPVSLADDLEFHPNASGKLSLRIESPSANENKPTCGLISVDDPAWQIPEDDRKLVLKAAGTAMP